MAERMRIERKAKFPVGCWGLWAAITKPAELSRWFGAEVTKVEPRVGGRILVRDPGGRLHRAVVETVEVPRRFAFRWLPASVGPGEDGSDEFLPGSLVELTVEETDEGSVLTVVETAPKTVNRAANGAANGAVNEALLSQVRGPLFLAGPLPDPIGAPPRIEARLMAGAGARA
ncbi:MAG: SRPBCC domain-containing protein [Actinomycetota bacterium]